MRQTSQSISMIIHNGDVTFGHLVRISTAKRFTSRLAWACLTDSLFVFHFIKQISLFNIHSNERSYFKSIQELRGTSKKSARHHGIPW